MNNERPINHTVPAVYIYEGKGMANLKTLKIWVDKKFNVSNYWGQKISRKKNAEGTNNWQMGYDFFQPNYFASILHLRIFFLNTNSQKYKIFSLLLEFSVAQYMFKYGPKFCDSTFLKEIN